MDYLRRKIYNIFKYFLLILFVGYYCGITLFYHAHTLKGEVIVHSHPFKHDSSNKSPFENHNHGKGEYALIHLLDNVSFDETGTSSFLPDPIFSYTLLAYIPIIDDFHSCDGLGFQLRGPPNLF